MRQKANWCDSAFVCKTIIKILKHKKIGNKRAAKDHTCRKQRQQNYKHKMKRPHLIIHKATTIQKAQVTHM